MYGPTKTQKQRAGRVQVCCFTTYGTGLDCLSIAELQRTSIINRHFQTIFREQQWETCPLRKGFEATRMDQQCNHPQGKKGATRQGAVIRNTQGSQAEQSKLVRTYLAVIGLVARDGYSQVGVHQRFISGKQFQTPKKWSRSESYSFKKWSRGISHYFRKWSYQPLLGGFPTSLSEQYLDLAIYRTLQRGNPSWL